MLNKSVEGHVRVRKQNAIKRPIAPKVHERYKPYSWWGFASRVQSDRYPESNVFAVEGNPKT